MKIAVTGANGFLGRGLVKQLLDNNLEVVAISRNIDGLDARAELIQKNVFEMKDPYLEMKKPNVVLHLAWIDGFNHNANGHVDNLADHFHFLEKVFSSPVDMVSVMGTAHEIGFFEGAVQSTTPTNPSNFYGIAKNALRQLVEELASKNNKKYQWLRAFYIIDNDPSGQSIFSKIIQANDRGDKLFPFVDGKNQFDFLPYNEFSSYVAKTVSQLDITGIINIASGYPQSIGSVMENFIEGNKLDIKLDYGRFPTRKYDSKAIWGDSSKLDSIIQKSNIQ